MPVSTSQSEQDRRQGLYRVVCAVALVGCVFSLTVTILLLSNLMTIRTASPLGLTELEGMRAAFKANPADVAVQSRIRDLDWAARQFYFSGLASRRVGLLLLLGGLAVTLGSLRLMVVLRKRVPDPRDLPAPPERGELESSARWTLAGVATALLTAAIYIGFAERAKPVPRLEARVPAAGGGKSETSGALTNWVSFRGPSGSGVALSSSLPVVWDGASGSGLLWKAEVPLPGMSSPVIWGNRVFLTGATEEHREVYCFDIDTGTLLWKVEVRPDAAQTRKIPEVFKETGFAAATPVTDGQAVYSLFANGDLVAVDLCSQVLWTRDLGVPVNRYGHSSSLALYQGRVLVQYDQEAGKGTPSALLVLDAVSGKTVQCTPRQVDDSWPSPVLVTTEKGPQLVTMANTAVVGYDPASGHELWKVTCAGSDVAPSPILAGGLVIAAVTGDKVYAIRPDGHGDVTATHVVWTSDAGVADVASPVSNGELVFQVQASGLMTCLDLKTGAKVWEQGLEGEFYGSPGLAGDRIYLAARNGQVLMLKAGRAYTELGRASLGEPSDGSPVFDGNRILFRGVKHLFCVGVK